MERGVGERLTAEILELKSICKYYGSFATNEDISLRIKRGTVHTVVGENGAGKSMLMNIITGANQPTSGEIFLNGKKVNFQDANDTNRVGIGMVQQEFMLFDKLLVLDNIIMGHEDMKKGFFINRKENSEKIKNICEEYRFHFDLNTLVRDLPVVVQQQMEIVKALFRKADITILDEPTAVLPYQEAQGLFKATRYLISQGKMVIFITHELKEVLEISDTIMVMKGGAISGEISAGEATELTFTNMTVGRDVVLKLGKRSGHSERGVLSTGNLVVKDDRKITRVKNISLCLREGEIPGIVGVLGNGQNELVEAITGMRSHGAGMTCLYGEKLPAETPRNNRLECIGYIPQDRINVGSSVDSSLVKNCIMGYHLNHSKKKGNLMDYQGAELFADSIIEEYNVKMCSSKDRAGSFFGGNLQKLIVGKEFPQNHRVLLIEDLMRGIDVGSIEFIWREIRKQAEKEGVPVTLITYDLAEATTFSDRILVMYDGHVNRELTGPDYDEREIGMYMMGGGSDER